MNPKTLIAELLATGLTQQELASLVQCSQSLVSALLRGERGSRLSFQIGQSLIALHKRRCKKKSLKAA